MHLVSNVHLGYFWVTMTHSENLSPIPINMYFCVCRGVGVQERQSYSNIHWWLEST